MWKPVRTCSRLVRSNSCLDQDLASLESCLEQGLSGLESGLDLDLTSLDYCALKNQSKVSRRNYLFLAKNGKPNRLIAGTNCSQTTGERLASSLPSHCLVSLALAWLKGPGIRIVDDDITPHNSRWSVASTKELRRERERERERECEIKREREREVKKRQQTQRERERAKNLFHDEVRIYNFKFSRLVCK